MAWTRWKARSICRDGTGRDYRCGKDAAMALERFLATAALPAANSWNAIGIEASSESASAPTTARSWARRERQCGGLGEVSKGGYAKINRPHVHWVPASGAANLSLLAKPAQNMPSTSHPAEMSRYAD